jgi:hypothetical protein
MTRNFTYVDDIVSGAITVLDANLPVGVMNIGGDAEEKLMRFDGIEISKIRIAKFNTLAAVYIDKTRICFGGKSSTFEQAVEIAKNFAEELLHRHPEAIIVNSIK